MPVLIPVTTPEASTVALEGLPLVHVPPGTGFVSVIVEPIQTVLLPDMGPGAALTVTDFVLLHPSFVYDIVTTPADTPFTSPPVAVTVAIALLLLLHMPPAVRLASVMVVPAQSDDGPMMAEGEAFTVSVFDVRQPPIE